MSETWAVVDESGVIHEVDVEAGRGSPPSWWAKRADGVARRSPEGARAAVLQLAYACGWSIVEVLAPGAVSRAGINRERDEARGLLDAVREALGPTCADATHEALPGLVRTVVQCDAATHEWCDEQREQLREMASEVAHLEARRGALLAEVDRLTAALATARLDGAREMRERAAAACELAATTEANDRAYATMCSCAVDVRALPLPEAPVPQPVAWGAMPTAAEVAARCKGREEPHRGAPWMRRHADTSGDFVEVVYLRAIDGLMFHREPDGAVWYLMRAVHETSRWRPINDDGASAQEVARG